MTPLHYFGDIIRNLMLAIPLPMVRVLFIATFVALLLWVWRLPRDMTSPPLERKPQSGCDVGLGDPNPRLFIAVTHSHLVHLMNETYLAVAEKV